MKKFLFLMVIVALFFIGANSSHAYSIGEVIAQEDLKQNPGAENLLEDHWGFDVLDIGEIAHSATLDGGAEVRVGTWWTDPPQDLLGISWKADGHWQVFALDPNTQSGTWDLTDLWAKIGKDYELSNIHGYISSVPEPSTMLLLGFGLVGLAVVGRKKFQQGNIE